VGKHGEVKRYGNRQDPDNDPDGDAYAGRVIARDSAAVHLRLDQTVNQKNDWKVTPFFRAVRDTRPTWDLCVKWTMCPSAEALGCCREFRYALTLAVKLDENSPAFQGWDKFDTTSTESR